MNIRTVNQRFFRPASGSPQTIDLYEAFQLADDIIWNMTLILRGTMTSTGGGAITGFHRDAPAGMITNVKLGGQYEPWGGRREIFNAPPQQLFWPGNYTNGISQALLRTSAGAASTDPWRAAIPIPLRDPRFRHGGKVYADIRDYSSLLLEIRNWEVDANLATTNLSTVQAVEIDVVLDLVEEGPPKGAAHFEPSLAYKEVPMVSTTTKGFDSAALAWDGYATAIWLQQFDDSQTGDAERANGLLRQFTIKQANVALIDDKVWDSALRDTWTKYRPALTTTELAGVAGIPLDPPWDGRKGPANILRDTQTTPPPGVTAVTPAVNDALFTLIVGADGVHGGEKLIG
jgi:hypothetical protein